MSPTKCVVFFSGGIMSWAAAKRSVSKYGAENTTLLFTDTLIEDPDLYRFLEEAATDIGAPLVRIADGRTPWQVFNDVGMIGNTRSDPCSRILKREIGQRWITENCDPQETALVFGIHIEESHRFDGVDAKTGKKIGVKNRYNSLGWPYVEAPMCEAPWLSYRDINAQLYDCGIKRPHLYDLGFTHNNCGGFCVKAGEGHFLNLLAKLPDVYAGHEVEEDAFNAARPDKEPMTVLAPQRRQDNGDWVRVPISLKEFREAGRHDPNVSLFDTAGCGCFLDD